MKNKVICKVFYACIKAFEFMQFNKLKVKDIQGVVQNGEAFIQNTQIGNCDNLKKKETFLE